MIISKAGLKNINYTTSSDIKEADRQAGREREGGGGERDVHTHTILVLNSFRGGKLFMEETEQ
jgi:hypothetical protein